MCTIPSPPSPSCGTTPRHPTLLLEDISGRAGWLEYIPRESRLNFTFKISELGAPVTRVCSHRTRPNIFTTICDGAIVLWDGYTKQRCLAITPNDVDHPLRASKTGHAAGFVAADDQVDHFAYLPVADSIVVVSMSERCDNIAYKRSAVPRWY